MVELTWCVDAVERGCLASEDVRTSGVIAILVLE